MNKVKQLSDLIGHTLQRVDVTEDTMVFVLENGNTCKLYHEQDCCEYVYIEDVVGDVNDLVGVPILKAEKVSNYEGPETIHTRDMDSYTWTFYKFATIKGYVDVRWLGESNGYYSESVDFEGEV